MSITFASRNLDIPNDCLVSCHITLSVTQDGVEIFMQAENAEICRQLRARLGRSHDMSRTLLRIKKASGRLEFTCESENTSCCMMTSQQSKTPDQATTLIFRRSLASIFV